MSKIPKEMKRQLIVLSIVLVIVIIITIVITVNGSKSLTELATANTDENAITETNEITINGVTKNTMEELYESGFADDNAYNDYMSLYEAYENGETPYVDNEVSDENKLDDDDLNSIINELEANNEYYYLTEDGEETNIKIYNTNEIEDLY